MIHLIYERIEKSNSRPKRPSEWVGLRLSLDDTPLNLQAWQLAPQGTVCFPMGTPLPEGRLWPVLAGGWLEAGGDPGVSSPPGHRVPII